MAGAPVREADGGLKASPLRARLAGGIGTALIFAVAAFWAVLMLGGHLQHEERRKLLVTGAQADAVVTYLSSSRRGVFSYRFTVGEATYEARDRPIAWHMREAAAPGNTVRVWFDPAHPLHCVTEAEIAAGDSWWNHIASAALWVGLLAWGIARLRRRAPATAIGPATIREP